MYFIKNQMFFEKEVEVKLVPESAVKVCGGMEIYRIFSNLILTLFTVSEG